MAKDIQFQWNKPIGDIVYNRSGGDKGRLFLANECRRLMDPYVPSSQVGMLRGSSKVYVKDHTGYVEYNMPYAHYQWEGILYVSSITGSSWAKHGEHKIKTNKELKQNRTFHPLATSHWDKAMYTANKARLARSYERWLKLQHHE